MKILSTRSLLPVLLVLGGVVVAGGAPSTGKAAVALLEQGRFEEALPALDAALKAEPGDMGLGIAKVKCLIELGRWDEALSGTEALVAQFPKGEEPRILLGDCLFLNFEPRRAVEVYRPLLDNEKWAPTVLPRVANALLAFGDDSSARSLVRSWRERGNPLPDSALTIAYRISEGPEERLSILREFAARHPQEGTVPGEIKLWESLESGGSFANKAPEHWPGRSKLREIYGEPALQIRLEGRHKSWIGFDTGNERVLIKADTARKLKLAVLAPATYEGWGYRGPHETQYVLVKRLEVAGRTLENIPAIVDDHTSEFWSNKAGTLGLDPFKGDVVLYDRRGGALTLWPPGTSAEKVLGGAGVTLPLMWARDLPLVPVKIQGRGPFPFLLDTGATFSLLASQFAPRLGIRVNTGKYPNIHGLGASGAFSSGITERVTFTLAGTVFERPLALVTDIPQRFPVPVYGVLGRDLLNEFEVVFDGPSATATFRAYDTSRRPKPPVEESASTP
jgi:tetratricopeptide (TPR) repeat protein